MSNKIALSLAATAILSSLVACNSDEIDSESTVSSSALVTSFSLSEDDNVVENLDSVFFSIDLANAKIFNADSLPYGTNITKLVPVISVSGASAIELKVTRTNGTDTTYNYIENSTDSIDFSNGPVNLRVVALDGVTEMNYQVKVNVHTVVADTLAWTLLEENNYPTRFSKLDDQRTTQTGAGVYCLSASNGEYCIATAENPEGQWQYTTPQFGFTPDLNTFNGTDNALYILDADGNLYTSTDGKDWTSLGVKWNYIYGNYGTKLLGCRKDNGKWYHTTYPAEAETEMPANFPISGTSQTVNYTFKMSTSHQLSITGGRLADGSVSASSWGYDGTTWAKLSKYNLPYPMENIAIVPYFVTSYDLTTWTATKESVLIAIGGNLADGSLNDTVYVSPDFGMHWEQADSLMQLPQSVPSRTRAQAFVYDRKFYARSSAAWSPVYKFDNQNYVIKATANTTNSRATTEITEWDCPYIYWFGGQDKNGNTYKTVYRGVVNRLTFKPLQ
jgi:hypothetical protein